MPAKSKAQQQAAGIAHAVEKGEMPKSKLRGASKRMFQSMRGTGELRKFAKTKSKSLPKHVPEALTACEMFERDRLMPALTTKSKADFLPIFENVNLEGRDDAPKLGLGKTGLKFARMQSKEAFKTDGGTDQKWKTSLKLRAHLANENPSGKMKSADKVGKVPRTFENAITPEQVVAELLPALDRVEL